MTPHYTIAAEPVECVRQGHNVRFSFIMHNNGSDLGNFRVQNSDGAIVTDNRGNSYTFDVAVGGNTRGHSPFPPGVPVRVDVTVFNVSSTAAAFSIVKLWGISSVGNANSIRGHFTFRNIPIS
jgi:hypothetical protein